MSLRRSLAVLVAASTATAVGPLAGTGNASSAASCAGAVSWQSARSMVGRIATIRGFVAGTKYAESSNGAPTFLDVGVDYPDSRRFQVVIWREDRSKFGLPESRYLRKTICVHGLVHTYRGVPEIEVRSPSQITIAG
jgi:hypothetical protein